MPAALSHQQALPRLGEVAHDLLGSRIDNGGTNRHRQDKILTLGTCTVGTTALLPVLRIEATGVAVVHQRVEVLVGLQIHRAAVTAIAAVRATLFDELLPTKATHAVAHVPGLYKNKNFHHEFHGNPP